MTVNLSDPRELHGAAVTGDQGVKLGKVDNVYFDNNTQRPEWAAVKTGLLGSHVSLVPLATADYSRGELHLPYTKAQVQAAPHHDPDQALSVQEEKDLFQHYGVDYGGDTVTATEDHNPAPGTRSQTGQDTREGVEQPGGRPGGTAGTAGAEGRDVSGPETDDAMTRSEEHLRAGTETVETGRARLRKYVVTDQETVTVPVSHEEVRVEREPITETNRGAAHDGPGISEEEHEVTLHAERPVVSKEAAPVERVRMSTETVREQQQVTDEVRSERIEVDDSDAANSDDAHSDDADTGDARR